VPVSDVEDAEPAQTIDILASVDVGEHVAVIGKLDGGIERAFGTRLAIFEKTGIDVVAKTVDGLAYDPGGLRPIDRRGVNEV